MVTAINAKEVTRRKAGRIGREIVTRRKAGTIGAKMVTAMERGGMNMWRSRQNTNNSRAQEIKIESGRAKAGQRRMRKCHLASVSPDCRGLKRADGAALKKMPSSRWRGMIRLKRPLRST